MDFKVIFRETFLKDLERIIRKIAVHNSDAALKLGEIIIQASESLSFFPERYPRVRQRPGIRRLIVKRISKYSTVFTANHGRSRFCVAGMDGGNPGRASTTD
jgi:hypothetical protein